MRCRRVGQLVTTRRVWPPRMTEVIVVGFSRGLTRTDRRDHSGGGEGTATVNPLVRRAERRVNMLHGVTGSRGRSRVSLRRENYSKKKLKRATNERAITDRRTRRRRRCYCFESRSRSAEGDGGGGSVDKRYGGGGGGDYYGTSAAKAITAVQCLVARRITSPVTGRSWVGAEWRTTRL